MWDALKDILNGSNAWFILAFILVFALIFIFFSSTGLIKVNLKHIQIGNGLTQRELIRRQVETAHVFIMSLYGKIVTDENEHNGYFTKYVLERCYDKVIEWIIFNHITTNKLYIQDKQEAICNLVYMMGVKDEFRTPEFKKRMNNWCEELIEQLVKVKEVYQ